MAQANNYLPRNSVGGHYQGGLIIPTAATATASTAALIQEHQQLQQMQPQQMQPQQMQQQQMKQQQMQQQQHQGNSQMNYFVNQQQLSQPTQHHLRPHQAPTPQLQPHAQPPSQQTHQQFLPGPFYTLQQQQAIAQARLAAAAQAQAAQAQQWQQQQAQQQAQAQLKGATVAAQPQKVVYPAFSLVGHSQHQAGPLVGSGVGAVAQIAHSATSSAAAALGAQTALNFNSNPSVSNSAMDGGLIMPPATMFAAGSPSASFVAATATPPATAQPLLGGHRGVEPTGAGGVGLLGQEAPIRNKRRKSRIESESDNNKQNTPNKKTSLSSRMAASKNKSPEKALVGTGLLPTSIASLTSGMCSSAATLILNAMDESNNCDVSPNDDNTEAFHADFSTSHEGGGDGGGKPTIEQKKQTSRNRNREHARCTRLRKKAFVTKLKELVDGLHAERNEDARKRRVAVQQLAEIQELRRKVVHTFLDYHCKFEGDYNKWSLILESGDGKCQEEFWLKQPVTPYRSFRRSEIQKGSRILRGVDAMIRDSASMSLMIETIGSRNLRWLHRKRDDFLTRDASKNHARSMTVQRSHAVGAIPHAVRHNTQLQHHMSSLSSNSGSSTGFGSSSDEERRLAQRRKTQGKGSSGQHDHLYVTNSDSNHPQCFSAAANVSSSSSSHEETRQQLLRDQHHGASNEFHDYDAPSLLDPLPDSGRSISSGSDGIDSDNCVVGRQMCTDSSSGDDEKINNSVDADLNPPKRRKSNNDCKQNSMAAEAAWAVASSAATGTLNNLPPNIARSGGITHNVKAVVPLPTAIVATAAAHSLTANDSLPNGKTNLRRAPAVALPPFVGIGNKKYPQAMKLQSTALSADNGESSNVNQKAVSSSSRKPPAFLVPNRPHRPLVARDASTHDVNGIDLSNENNSSNAHQHGAGDRNIISINNDTSTYSQSSSQNQLGIRGHYHINEDDMIITDDVLMCPFIFRSQEAVWCGALSECVQPGMLRACFSSTNKLCNVEMIFDAMGFCQQLERASGNEGMAQIIPNSLEMALAPNSEEARAITLAEPPFRIVSVNEVWTSMTGYTQLDAEGKDLSMLYGDHTDLDAGVRSGMAPHDFRSVASGVCAASTNLHYDIRGREFLNFMCSYPLSNLSNEVTHILHVCKELPPRS